MDSASKTVHMLSLRLPGNVEREVNLYREELFHRTGAVSTQALSPLIPLAWFTRTINESVVDTLPQTELPPLEPGHQRVVGGATMLGIFFPARWSEWIRSQPHYDVSPDTVCNDTGLPPALSGIFLGARDLTDALIGSRAPQLPQTLPRQFTVVHVEFLTLLLPGCERWWSRLDWQVYWSRRVKLRG